MKRAALTALALLIAWPGDGLPQPPARRITNVPAVRQYPGYFHLQNVLVHGELVENGSFLVLRGGERDIPVILNDAKTASGPVEVRGQVLDVGRLEPGDVRLRSYPGAKDPEQWPRPGEDPILSITSVSETQLATSPSIRALALQPWRFAGQKVTVIGEFRGRNLFGDQPSTPGKSRWDFVLRMADAAVWVTDLRPRGRGFELSVDARVDTGRWLQVSGTVAEERGLLTIVGATVESTAAPQLPPPEDEAPTAPPPAEPGEVVFSSPTEGEIDVPSGTSVRLQFSRGLDQPSLTDRIRVSYAGAAADAAPIEFTTSYDAASRAVEIRFARPLEPYRTVRIELLEGIRTFDTAPVRPSTLTFSVAGN